jgi:hypothetical protein
MKILFLRLFSRILRFWIESNFKSCKKISLIFFVKTQDFSKETGGWKKIFNFKCNLLSSASFGQVGFFPLKENDHSFQT